MCMWGGGVIWWWGDERYGVQNYGYCIIIMNWISASNEICHLNPSYFQNIHCVEQNNGIFALYVCNNYN